MDQKHVLYALRGREELSRHKAQATHTHPRLLERRLKVGLRGSWEQAGPTFPRVLKFTLYSLNNGMNTVEGVRGKNPHDLEIDDRRKGLGKAGPEMGRKF